MSDTVGTKTFTELRKHYGKELGLVMMGVGAPLNEWVDGIAGMLVENCEATMPVFSEAFTLSDNIKGSKGRTDLVLVLHPETNVNVGKLATVRIQLCAMDMRASWIEDFLSNYRGDYSASDVPVTTSGEEEDEE